MTRTVEMIAAAHARAMRLPEPKHFCSHVNPRSGWRCWNRVKAHGDRCWQHPAEPAAAEVSP